MTLLKCMIEEHSICFIIHKSRFRLLKAFDMVPHIDLLSKPKRYRNEFLIFPNIVNNFVIIYIKIVFLYVVDVISVWDNVSEYIAKQMSQSKVCTKVTEFFFTPGYTREPSSGASRRSGYTPEPHYKG